MKGNLRHRFEQQLEASSRLKSSITVYDDLAAQEASGKKGDSLLEHRLISIARGMVMSAYFFRRGLCHSLSSQEDDSSKALKLTYPHLIHHSQRG
jgi:hypothetical protein